MDGTFYPRLATGNPSVFAILTDTLRNGPDSETTICPIWVKSAGYAPMSSERGNLASTAAVYAQTNPWL